MVLSIHTLFFFDIEEQDHMEPRRGTIQEVDMNLEIEIERVLLS